MPLKRISLLLLATLIGAPVSVCGQDSAETDQPDIQAVHDFRIQLIDAFRQEDWARLQSMASAAATEKLRFPGGTWKLSILYTTLMGPGSLTATDDRWILHFAKLQRWSDAMPSSAVPRIALARAYERYAWKARGNGWANTVTSDGWKNFHGRLQTASTVLEQCKELSDINAEWFHAMEIVALGESWSKDKSAQLVQAAIAFEPGYMPTYTEHMDYLLPKWHGNPGEASEFLTTASNNLGGDQGDFLYFWEIMTFRKSRGDLPNVSWDRVKRGFTVAESLYTSTNFERNAIAYLAAKNGDKEFAEGMFGRIGSDWNAQIWGSKPAYDSAKASVTAQVLMNQ